MADPTSAPARRRGAAHARCGRSQRRRQRSRNAPVMPACGRCGRQLQLINEATAQPIVPTSIQLTATAVGQTITAGCLSSSQQSWCGLLPNTRTLLCCSEGAFIALSLRRSSCPPNGAGRSFLCVTLSRTRPGGQVAPRLALLPCRCRQTSTLWFHADESSLVNGPVSEAIKPPQSRRALFAKRKLLLPEPVHGQRDVFFLHRRLGSFSGSHRRRSRLRITLGSWPDRERIPRFGEPSGRSPPRD